MEEQTTTEQVNQPQNETFAEEVAADQRERPLTEEAESEILPQKNNESNQFFDKHSDRIKSFFTELLTEKNETNTSEASQEFAARLKALEEKEQQLNFEKLQMDTTKLLESKKIPTSIMKLVVGSDMPDTIQNIEIFEKVFNDAVQEQVCRRLAGKTPQSGDTSFSFKKAATEQAIRNIMNRG